MNPDLVNPVLDISSHNTDYLRNRHFNGRPDGLLMIVGGYIFVVLGLVVVLAGGMEKNWWTGPVVLALVCLGGASVIAGVRLRAPIRWKCPGCKRPLHAREPWRCGLCGTENRKSSFLGRCENPVCEAVPPAFECQHQDCRTLTYLTKERDSRNPARSINVPPPPPGPTPLETIRAEKSFKLETTDLERRLFEAEAEKLEAEIRVVQLQKQRNTREPVTLTPHQARIKWAAEQFEEAEFLCTTVPQTVERELRCHAMIDANPNIKDDVVRQQMKRAMSMHFESMRIALKAADVQVQKDHR